MRPNVSSPVHQGMTQASNKQQQHSAQQQPNNKTNINSCQLIGEPPVASQPVKLPSDQCIDGASSSMIVCPLASQCLAAFLLPSMALLLCSIPSLGTPLGLLVAIALAQLIALQLPTFLTNVTGTRYLALVDPNIKPTRQSILQSLGIALILGCVMKIGIDLITCEQQQLLLLGIYLVLLSLFHFGEYFVTALTNPETLDLNSYLLNNSLAYTVAISLSFVEFLSEVYLFPHSKPLNAIALLGLTLAIFGETIRKLAMFTAGRNFSHMISTSKSATHQLVTHGVYSIFRHPSYAGWFYWAVGTQILLQNPICFVIFNLAACQFFKDRINYEEELLTKFFGKDYDNYKEKVKLWMPV